VSADSWFIAGAISGAALVALVVWLLDLWEARTTRPAPDAPDTAAFLADYRTPVYTPAELARADQRRRSGHRSHRSDT
jgi:hypothetical protein